jgi:ceramide glucosyltransferase
VLLRFAQVVSFLGCIGAAGYYLLCLRGVFEFRRVRRGEGKQPSSAASVLRVSLLKPVRGADPQAYESLRSHCLLDYPDYEIIFGVADRADPAVPIIARLIAEFPARRIELVVCGQALGTNRKVSNLIQMLPHARYEYLLITDSDIRVPPDYLRRVVMPFASPQVGMVTCLYRGVAAQTLGSKLEALGISTDFFAGVLASWTLSGRKLRFAFGSTLAMHRAALSAIGGFEPLVDFLADDFELGKRIAEAGFEVVLSNMVVETYLPDHSFADFFAHQLRWARSIRGSRPWGYIGVLLTYGLPWGLAALAAYSGGLWGWGLLILMVTLRLAVADSVGRSLLGDSSIWPRILLLPLRDLISLAVWVDSFTGRRVRWRDEEFILEKGRLRPA